MAAPKNGFYTPNDADELRINFDGVEKLVVNATGVAFNGAEPAAQTANITDASEAHALNATFSDTEVEAALNALGVKVNAVIAALIAAGIVAAA
jgi:hypothetical protein